MPATKVGRIMHLDEKLATIEVQHLGLHATVPVTPDTPGFALLEQAEIGSQVSVEVELIPAGRTSTKDNLVINQVLGLYHPPIIFTWEGKGYEVPAGVAGSQDPVTIVLDSGTAVRVPWWKESMPPQPGEINPVQLAAPAKSVQALAYLLGGTHANVTIARRVPVGPGT